MFTGIVEELGTVRALVPGAGGARLELSCHRVLADAVLGASIAVNGCCLTVIEFESARPDAPGRWSADVHAETLERTNLGRLQPGDRVNLERPVRLVDRLAGHLVQGHVDGVGTVAGAETLPDGSRRVDLDLPPSLARYVVEKGSITLDGVSLTVTHVGPDRCGVALIPHTLAVTTFGLRAPGDAVNIEVDVLAKYLERLAAWPAPGGS